MEALSSSLFIDSVPENWVRRAYPSLLPLGLWYADLLQRVKELESWTSDFQLPAAVWLAGFFNPQSFLTAIMQQMARKNEWPLDRMVLQCDVTKKSREDMAGPPREGAYVHGLYMEGNSSALVISDMFFLCPVRVHQGTSMCGDLLRVRFSCADVCYVVVWYDAISCLLCCCLLLCHIMFVMLLSAMMPYHV